MRRICKPLIKYESRLPPPGTPLSPIRKKPPAWQPAPDPAPIDVEQDDPYGLSPTSARETGTRVARSPSPSPNLAPNLAPVHAYAPPPSRPALAAEPRALPEPLPLSSPTWSSGPIY